jgi:hypothetical protein
VGPQTPPQDWSKFSVAHKKHCCHGNVCPKDCKRHQHILPFPKDSAQSNRTEQANAAENAYGRRI